METPSAQDARKALTGAKGFLAVEGAPLHRLRLGVLLGDEPSAALERALMPLLGATSGDACVALEVLEALADAQSLRTALAERVAASLRASQHPDGSWRASGSAAPAVAEDRSGPVGASDPLFVTAMLGGFLGRTAQSSAAALRAAGDYLAVHWSPALAQGGSWYALSGYAHFFSNIPHEISDAVLQWCGRELERAFRTGAFDVVRVARVFTLCDAHALPGAKLDARELVPALLRAQSADGGWPGATPSLRASNTLWAAFALVSLQGRSWRAATR